MKRSDRLWNDLLPRLNSDSFPQCCVISGGGEAERARLAADICMGLLCQSGDRPCGQCAQCGKVERGMHPDVITVSSDKAQLPIDLIRDMRADAFVRPNEGRRKIYLIPQGEKLSEPCQNAMLKVIEEPPPYASFIIMMDSAATLLDTVRSRCAVYRLPPAESADEPEPPPSAAELVDALLDKDPAAVSAFFVTMDRGKGRREQLAPLCAYMRRLLCRAGMCAEGAAQEDDSARRLARAYKVGALLALSDTFQRSAAYLDGGAGEPHICGMLSAELCQAAVAKN